ncbi:septation protein SepH [Corynebacterium aquatimens]|uniref:DUF3071 domain-containing protein n=1 Tax=Corynebacterium aquatimens TaxID=1190508 RepID=A0A931GRH5_9CORY|nr:septation protein SepH [Corynebacterium aquatimens]MBG6121047.1 hypothetical protein [Corynebacterium aquatimens]WJY66396.1 hypothetical protein CAQUA_08515 [Corynebacterium aquatimens]
MRELFLVAEESTNGSEGVAVFRDDQDERYSIATSELEGLITPDSTDASKDDSSKDESASDTTFESVEPTAEERSALFSTPLSLRPREIQERIRSGTGLQELADEMAVAASRIEPYAHPVLLERTQMAESAKQSHPVRGGEPAADTLYQVLATAFAAHGHSLSDATWDAVRHGREPWIVRVSWKSGLSEHHAEWTLQRSVGGTTTTEPRDAMAADLINPQFAQPVRSIPDVAPRRDDAVEPAPLRLVGDDDVEPGRQELSPRNAADHDADGHAAGHNPAGEPATDPHEEPSAPEEPTHDPQELFATGELLVNPEESEAPRKRKRKAVTPHWEDVLLGVRTNTKRPK